MRPAVALTPDMSGMVTARFVGADADINRDARIAKPLVAGARHFGVRVFKRGDDARNSRSDDGIGAGRRLAKMRAWFKRDIERRAARGLPGTAQRLDLGMGPAAGLRPAASNDDAVFHDHRTNGRIGPRAA